MDRSSQDILDRGGRALANGPVYTARLAEAAPSCASPGHFHAKPVVNYFHKRNHGCGGVGRGIEVLHHPSGHAGVALEQRAGFFYSASFQVFHIEEGGDVYAFYACQPPEEILLPPSFLIVATEGFDYVENYFFPVAQHHCVEKISEWFWIVGARATSDYKGVIFCAFFPEQGNASQPQHEQYIGIAQFVLQGETHQVEPAKRKMGFLTGELEPSVFQEGDIVFLGGKESLGCYIRA